MLKNSRNIIHVEIKGQNEHIYFGSISAMFKDTKIKNLIGIEYQTFRTKNLSSTKVYENEFLIIRKGNLKIIDYISKK